MVYYCSCEYSAALIPQIWYILGFRSTVDLSNLTNLMFIYDSDTQPRKCDDDEEFIDGIGSAEMQAVSHWSLSPRTQCPTWNARCRVGKGLMTKLAVSHNYVQLVITVLGN